MPGPGVGVGVGVGAPVGVAVGGMVDMTQSQAQAQAVAHRAAQGGQVQRVKGDGQRPGFGKGARAHTAGT
jgi:hypothetical protein